MSGPRFATVPDHARVISELHPVTPTYMTDVAVGWRAPIALWKSDGFDGTNRPDEYSHYTLAMPLAATVVRRVSAAGKTLEEQHGARSDSCLQLPFADHRFVAPGPIRFAHIYLQPALLASLAVDQLELANDLESALMTDRAFARDSELRLQADAYLRRAANLADPPCAFEMDARADVLGIEIIRSFSNLRLKHGKVGGQGLAPWQERRSIEFLRANLREHISLDELAAIAKLSTFHFARNFK